VGFAEWSDLFHAHTRRAWLSFKRNKKFRDEYMLTFMLDGLHFKTATIDSVVIWSHYDRVIEDSEIFLLMSGGSMYSAIPKRAFQGEDEVNRFRGIVKAAIPIYCKQRF
jgi:hypothetical protein